MKSILIGAAGHQGKKHLRHLQELSDVVAVIDPNIQKLTKLDICDSIARFDNLELALMQKEFDLALICVPHAHHYRLTERLLQAGKYIIKEKPFSTSTQEMNKYLNLIRLYNKPVFTISQRNNNNIFKLAKRYLNKIGAAKYYHYHYHLAKEMTTEHWRNDMAQSKGGVILDMGYHAINMIVQFFNLPKRVYSQRLSANKQEMPVETFMSLVLLHDQSLVGHVSCTNLSDKKHESLQIIGSKGVMTIKPTKLTLRRYHKNETSIMRRNKANDLAMKLQIADFINNLENKAFISEHLNQQIDTMKVIFAAYNEENQISTNTIKNMGEIS